MKKSWKWVLVLLGTIVLVSSLIVWDAHRRATATFEDHEREYKQLCARIRAMDGRRPSMYGQTVAGNAWDLYLDALDAIESIPDSESDIVPEIYGVYDKDHVPDHEGIEAFFMKHRPHFDQLKEALRRERVDPDYALDPEPAVEMMATEVIETSKFLDGYAAHLGRVGHEGEALEAIAILIGMSNDMASQGALVHHLVSWVCEDKALASIKAHLSGHALDPKALGNFARSLDRLRRTRPALAESWVTERAYVASAFLQGGERLEQPLGGGTPSASWRHFYSLRLARAEALNVLKMLISELISLSDLPMPEQIRKVREIAERLKRDDNEVVEMTFSLLPRLYEGQAERDSAWQLARTAVAVAWFQAERGDNPRALSDLVPRYLPEAGGILPDGTPLRYAPGKLWTYGEDGEDDGGSVGMYDGDPDGDVVWIVKRKK